MRIALLPSVVLAVLSLLSAPACGGGGADGDPAKAPSSSERTADPMMKPNEKVDPSAVATPNAEPAAPNDGARPTSASPGSPADGGKCKSGNPSSSAKDLNSCLDSCKGMDDTVPPGSRCVPAKNSCANQCSVKFRS